MADKIIKQNKKIDAYNAKGKQKLPDLRKLIPEQGIRSTLSSYQNLPKVADPFRYLNRDKGFKKKLQFGAGFNAGQNMLIGDSLYNLEDTKDKNNNSALLQALKAGRNL